jgi:SOS-response transcriptional repressor LexA
MCDFALIMEADMSKEPDKEARQRIEKAMKVTGWSATKLAKESGVAVSTMTRFLYRDPGYTISLKTLTKVDDAVRRYIMSVPDAQESIRLTLLYDGPGTIDVTAGNTINIHVRGAVQAGYFTEAMEWPRDDWENISLPRPDGHKSYFGLRVKGPSMNLIYPEDTILVCVPMYDYHDMLENGDHVIVQRWDAGMVEATVKELKRTEDGSTWLWPRSDHPEYQMPIALPANNGNHSDYMGSNDIRVVAVVVADYRVRRRRG